MSRAYLVEWVRQLWGRDEPFFDVDRLTTAELTQLILLSAAAEVQR